MKPPRFPLHPSYCSTKTCCAVLSITTCVVVHHSDTASFLLTSSLNPQMIGLRLFVRPRSVATHASENEGQRGRRYFAAPGFAFAHGYIIHTSSCYFEALLCEGLSRSRNPTGMRGAFRCGNGSSSTGVPLSPLPFLGCDPCWRPGPCPCSYVGHPEDVSRPIGRQPPTHKASFEKLTFPEQPLAGGGVKKKLETHRKNMTTPGDWNQ